MCGIGGAISLSLRPVPENRRRLAVMNELQAHRGPDGEGIWTHPSLGVGLAHRRLKVIDLDGGDQPMSSRAGNLITYNGEVYNYIELRRALGEHRFRTRSDTEVILEAYEQWGEDALLKLRGMFAFALWDERRQLLVCGRDRFGIKPFYYALVDDVLYFASEPKALLPFLPMVEIDLEAFKDYLTFQFCLPGKTLFEGIHELPPGHYLRVRNGTLECRRYWSDAEPPSDDPADTVERLQALMTEAISLHVRSDVPIGVYLSGGLDSSIVSALACDAHPGELLAFNGSFAGIDGYDETRYAREVAADAGFPLTEAALSAQQFVDNVERVIYHLDFPVAGPGSFAQFMICQCAAADRKVLLGGQGGDELFGGYARYRIAYLEQCRKAAIERGAQAVNGPASYGSVMSNFMSLRGYGPLLEDFWRDGALDDLEPSYFRLINRAADIGDEVRWALLGDYSPFDAFLEIFRAAPNGDGSSFEAMTSFDRRTLLPALLHVEDRVSMAHGIESRVPLLDHPLVEFVLGLPAEVKFKDGALKQLLRGAFASRIPDSVARREDKMGFPVPLQEWLTAAGPVRDFVFDVLTSGPARSRTLVDNGKVLAGIDGERRYGRRIWGLLSLELWQQAFHDQGSRYRELLGARMTGDRDRILT